MENKSHTWVLEEMFLKENLRSYNVDTHFF
jgi:hypothetical protein